MFETVSSSKTSFLGAYGGVPEQVKRPLKTKKKMKAEKFFLKLFNIEELKKNRIIKMKKGRKGGKQSPITPVATGRNGGAYHK